MRIAIVIAITVGVLLMVVGFFAGKPGSGE